MEDGQRIKISDYSNEFLQFLKDNNIEYEENNSNKIITSKKDCEKWLTSYINIRKTEIVIRKLNIQESFIKELYINKTLNEKSFYINTRYILKTFFMEHSEINLNSFICFYLKGFDGCFEEFQQIEN